LLYIVLTFCNNSQERLFRPRNTGAANTKISQALPSVVTPPQHELQNTHFNTCLGMTGQGKKRNDVTHCYQSTNIVQHPTVLPLTLTWKAACSF